MHHSRRHGSAGVAAPPCTSTAHRTSSRSSSSSGGSQNAAQAGRPCVHCRPPKTITIITRHKNTGKNGTCIGRHQCTADGSQGVQGSSGASSPSPGTAAGRQHARRAACSVDTGQPAFRGEPQTLARVQRANKSKRCTLRSKPPPATCTAAVPTLQCVGCMSVPHATHQVVHLSHGHIRAEPAAPCTAHLLGLPSSHPAAQQCWLHGHTKHRVVQLLCNWRSSAWLAGAQVCPPRFVRIQEHASTPSINPAATPHTQSHQPCSHVNQQHHVYHMHRAPQARHPDPSTTIQ